MFAYDTTLYDSSDDMELLIARFVNKLNPFIEWCKNNKLDINWSKTFFMFVTNKHIKNKLPKEIEVNGVMVQVVESFKLLGVTIDNRLNFTKYSADIRTIINRKLFSIKRLFYLSTSVKIQFFKTFILPYFDYCLSLLIYFPKSTIQTLSNCFNNCLFMLFKFKIEPKDDYDITDDDIINFNEKLQAYGLFSFQHRLMNKILTFAHNIIHNPNSPSDLKNILRTENINDIEQEDPAENFTQLRNGRQLKKNTEPSTRYNQLTFPYFFKTLIRVFSRCNFHLSPSTFKLNLITDINVNFFKFINTFSKFNILYKSYI